jgi:hypothetical protein
MDAGERSGLGRQRGWHVHAPLFAALVFPLLAVHWLLILLVPNPPGLTLAGLGVVGKAYYSRSASTLCYRAAVASSPSMHA